LKNSYAVLHSNRHPAKDRIDDLTPRSTVKWNLKTRGP